MRLFLLLPVFAILFWSSCEEEVNDPLISFENGIDSISEVFPGDLFTVNGEIIIETPILGAFYFQQKKMQPVSLRKPETD